MKLAPGTVASMLVTINTTLPLPLPRLPRFSFEILSFAFPACNTNH